MNVPQQGQGFGSWSEVLAYAEAKRLLRYKAPMDYHGGTVVVLEVKGERILCKPYAKDTDPFWADAGHLNRISVPG